MLVPRLGLKKLNQVEGLGKSVKSEPFSVNSVGRKLWTVKARHIFLNAPTK